MIEALFRSLAQLFSADLRSLLWRSMGLTILVLVAVVGALVMALKWAIGYTGLVETYPLIATYVVLLSSFGFSILSLYFLPAASMLVAGFFLDEVADGIERRDYSYLMRNVSSSTYSALIESLRFFGIAFVLNCVSLIFIFVPVLNIGIYFLLNAYLYGREYFYLVAARHDDHAVIQRRYENERGQIFMCGFIISAFSLIPILNLLTPLFATIFMVHIVHKRRISA